MPLQTGSGYWQRGGLARLWGAFFAGPAAAALNEGLGYAVMKPVCAGADAYLLWLFAAAALAVAVAGAWIGWRCLRDLRAAAEDGGTVTDRSLFLAIVAVSLDTLVGLLIVTSALPFFFLSPCE
jgi:hypothetical protein